MLKRYAPLLTAMILLWSAVLASGAVRQERGSTASPAKGSSVGQTPANPAESTSPTNPSELKPGSNPQQEGQTPSTAGISGYEGKIVQSIQLSGVAEGDHEHILQLLPQKAGEPLDRTRVGDSIRALYATGRFADIQAEVTPSGEGVTLAFITSANFFVGAVSVEGAPARPTQNQIVNASKFQLGELYTQDKLDRALDNVRQLMQEGGYYRARVTAEIRFKPGHPAGGYSLPHHSG